MIKISRVITSLRGWTYKTRDRFNLMHVAFRDGCAIATDGHSVIEVPVDSDVLRTETVLVPATTLALVEKASPKGNDDALLNERSITIGSGSTFTFDDNHDLVFPDTDVFLHPKKNAACFSIAVAGELLERLGKFARVFGERHQGLHPVRLLFAGSMEPIRFEVELDIGKRAIGVIMPWRDDPQRDCECVTVERDGAKAVARWGALRVEVLGSLSDALRALADAKDENT